MINLLIGHACERQISDIHGVHSQKAGYGIASQSVI